MFTGIVEELGSVVAVELLREAARVTVRGPAVCADARHGDSVAVNGVCLTVVGTDGEAFTADVMASTLQRTGLGGLGAGAPVNLERAVTPTGRLGGHLVQGHVDGIGRVLSRDAREHWEVVRIACPAHLSRYLVPQGSVAVDGVSLTVVDVTDGAAPAAPAAGAEGLQHRVESVDGVDGVDEMGPSFTVSLIPTTARLTTLGRTPVGGVVNLEVDVLAKYVERLLHVAPPPDADGRTSR